MGIAERYKKVERALAQACERCGRSPHDVGLIAVSKTVGVDGVEQAFSAGAKNFGENRPDQLVAKAEALPAATWHFIGNIQSRQIRHIVEHADLIHSLFELRHAKKISEVAQDLGKVQDVLIEVNVSGELSKSGAAPDEASDLLEEFTALPNVRVRGLMTMAPQGSMEAARDAFGGLRQLADRLRMQLTDSEAQAFDQLSMGMSEDWEIAVEEGATLVRIGRAIFSDSFE